MPPRQPPLAAPDALVELGEVDVVSVGDAVVGDVVLAVAQVVDVHAAQAHAPDDLALRVLDGCVRSLMIRLSMASSPVMKRQADAE